MHDRAGVCRPKEQQLARASIELFCFVSDHNHVRMCACVRVLSLRAGCELERVGEVGRDAGAQTPAPRSAAEVSDVVIKDLPRQFWRFFKLSRGGKGSPQVFPHLLFSNLYN